MKTDPIFYAPDELKFLKNNFFSMTNRKLLDRINSMRDKQVQLSSMLHQCRRLGLSRGIQIRWSNEDIEFLKSHYKLHGDMELAKLLTVRKRTFRIIKGEKVFRTFIHKNIEKKRELLGLKRTDKEIFEIRQRNLKIFPGIGYTSEDNCWSRGQRDIFPENEIRIWCLNDRPRKVIKINGKFEFMNRWNWENKHGPIPKSLVLSCKTNNPLNCDPDNWELISREEAIIKNRGSVELSDVFIISTMTYKNPDLKKIIRGMPELIELKRCQIKLKRTINELTQTTTND